MRIASILAASGVIAWLFCTLWNLPVSRALLFYTGWMFVITSTAYFIAQRIDQKSPAYVPFYVVMLTVLVVPVVIQSIQFGLTLNHRGLTGFVIFLFFAAWIRDLFQAHIPHSFEAEIMLAEAYAFCVCGLLTLASAVPLCTALQFRLRVTLGTYWLAVSIYRFCVVLGVVRARALWESIDNWAASAMCVAFLGGLAWMLSGVQIELGPQEHSSEQISELVWEAE